MTEDCILAIDAGTTGVTCLLVDHDGVVRASGSQDLTQHYPQPGWVEHDGEEIWRAVLSASAAALAASPGLRPVALGIANQRETMLFWDRRSGEPLHRAIVWQCRRSAGECEELRAAGLEPEIVAKTGLRLDPYFSGTKALWLTRHDDSLPRRIADGGVCFGTIDSWLAWRLSGGGLHVTDYTNASRTLAFDVDRLDWDDELLEVFGLNRGVMPQPGLAGSVRGVTMSPGAIPDGLPIASLVGDQQAALYGQACFAPGLIKASYGTGCFILMSTGSERVHPTQGLLATVAATSGGDGRRYAVEGSIYIAGAALQWCRDNLGLVATTQEAVKLAASVPDSGGVVFVPAFVGLGSPYWEAEVRGAMYGLTGATQPAHILRAALDSMAFHAQDVLSVMTQESGLGVAELRVDGGAAANNALMQLQADLAGVPVSRPVSVESTALGAAFLAGLAVGFWRDEAEVQGLRREAARIVPSDRRGIAAVEYGRWRTAVSGLLGTGLAPG